MDLLANELSIHQQFYDRSAFRNALAKLMAMRNVVRRFGSEVYCNRALLTAKPMPNMTMQQALGRLSNSERRAAMGWLTHRGPFWDDLRRHGANDYLECRDEVVTDSAIGEAAYRMLHGVDSGLISVTPSNWNFSPIEVNWRREAEGSDDRSMVLDNWWDDAALEIRLRDEAAPIQSWDDLQSTSTNRFKNLIFAKDCFEPLAGLPFAKSAAERILVLLDILDRFARAFDTVGRRTPEGQQIYQDYFTGGNALFSDSSDTEKNDFRQELTFPHPDRSQGPLFCSWHGKVRHMTLRLHYWWSGNSGKSVYVVYAGPKITKR